MTDIPRVFRRYSAYLQARIQGFSSGGGVQSSENYWQAKKKGEGIKEGCSVSILLFYGRLPLKQLYRHYFFYKYDIPWYFLHAKITFEMIVLPL